MYDFDLEKLFPLVEDEGADADTAHLDADAVTLSEEESQSLEGLNNMSANGSRAENDSASGFHDFISQNFPIVCKTYADPDTEVEKVLMVVSLPGGSQNVKIELIEDGQAALVKYSWPKPMYDVDDLFRRQLNVGDLTNHHPLVLCFKSALQECRKRIDFAPLASFKVNLPIKVQVVSSTWKKWGITRPDGSQVLLADFTGLAKEYNVTETDDVVRFGM